MTVVGEYATGDLEALQSAHVEADGTVSHQSGVNGVMYVSCGSVSSMTVSAVDAVGTTVTDVADAPC